MSKVSLGRDWHATGYVASLAAGPLSALAPLTSTPETGEPVRVAGLVLDTTGPAAGTLSMAIGAFFVGIAGSILTDLWLDRFMDRSRRVSAALGACTLLIGLVSLIYRPFG